MSIVPSSSIRVDRNPGPGSHEIIGPSTQRIAIHFFPPRQGVARISTEFLNSLDDGLPLFSGTAPYVLTLKLHGEIIQRAWNCINDATNLPVSFLEVLT